MLTHVYKIPNAETIFATVLKGLKYLVGDKVVKKLDGERTAGVNEARARLKPTFTSSSACVCFLYTVESLAGDDIHLGDRPDA